MFRAATFTMAKRWNGVEYYSALKRKEILSHITTQMNLKDTRLSHKASLGKFNKTEITSSIFSDDNSMRLEVNYKKKTAKNTNM